MTNPPILWSADDAKLLRKILNFNDQTKILSGDIDPSSVATAGSRGYLYISSNGGLYIKQDSGTTTNWLDLASDIAAVWGDITGTLSNQTDLQNALNLKVPYTGATGNVDLGAHSITASNVSGTNTGDVTLTSAGSSPNAAGASLSGQALTLQPADASNPGLVSTGTQTFAGRKNFAGGIGTTLAISSALITDGSGVMAASGTSSTELSYVTGVTSAIQTQLNSKQTSGNYITALTGGVTASGPGSVNATVVTNANLTGMVTSVGNATTVVTNANLTGPIASSGNATSITSQTGTGTTFVMQGSPTLTTPNLGTPTTLIGTNISGTAASLTAGNVTTNANLTGVITSIGNATSIASQTGTGTKFVVDTSPTLVTPLLGTPTSGVLTNCTGTASGLTAGNATLTEGIPFTFDGGGLVIANGSVSTKVIEYACTITGITLLSKISGSIILDVKKCTYAGYPGSLASIVGTVPQLSSGNTYKDTTLSSWSTSVSAGDIIEVSINGVPTSVQQLYVSLKEVRT